MSKNEKVTENKEQTEQKVMTKYDRKVQKRKEEKEKEKKEERISTAIGIVVLVALVCLVASFPIRTYLATHETYVVVNGEAVNKVEFDYQYNLTKNNYITQYGSYLTYFGLDTSKDLSTQMYSDTLTWQDYFEQNAVESLKQNKALMAEAKAAGFTYDTTDEYNTFKETIKTSAASAGISEKEYVRSIYGSYATMGRIEEYVKNDMVMNAYYQKLQEDNAPSDDEIQSYYEENKATYDSVDYRLTTIEAESAYRTYRTGRSRRGDCCEPPIPLQQTERQLQMQQLPTAPIPLTSLPMLRSPRQWKMRRYWQMMRRRPWQKTAKHTRMRRSLP